MVVVEGCHPGTLEGMEHTGKELRGETKGAMGM